MHDQIYDLLKIICDPRIGAKYFPMKLHLDVQSIDLAVSVPLLYGFDR